MPKALSFGGPDLLRARPVRAAHGQEFIRAAALAGRAHPAERVQEVTCTRDSIPATCRKRVAAYRRAFGLGRHLGRSLQLRLSAPDRQADRRPCGPVQGRGHRTGEAVVPTIAEKPPHPTLERELELELEVNSIDPVRPAYGAHRVGVEGPLRPEGSVGRQGSAVSGCNGSTGAHATLTERARSAPRNHEVPMSCSQHSVTGAPPSTFASSHARMVWRLMLWSGR